MVHDTVTTGSSVLLVIVGLILLLFGAGTPNDQFVNIGGVVVLIGLGVLTLFVARLE